MDKQMKEAVLTVIRDRLRTGIPGHHFEVQRPSDTKTELVLRFVDPAMRGPSTYIKVTISEMVG
jgi:hypothetical protein